MNIYEKIKTMNIEELTEYIYQCRQLDHTPWVNHFNSCYCENCEAIECEQDGKTELYAYCELHDSCKFFPDLNYAPELKDMIKLWLESEVEDLVKETTSTTM